MLSRKQCINTLSATRLRRLTTNLGRVPRRIHATPEDNIQAQNVGNTANADNKPSYGVEYYKGLLTTDMKEDNKASSGDMLKRNLQLAGYTTAVLAALMYGFLASNGLV